MIVSLEMAEIFSEDFYTENHSRRITDSQY